MVLAQKVNSLFNTKKVRLKLQTVLRDKISNPYFNTKKVRLKQRLFIDPSTTPNPPFQYQKGAIKTGAGRSKRGGGGRFQYQKGAIKTYYKGAAAPTAFHVFQYQKGAIKTGV